MVNLGLSVYGLCVLGRWQGSAAAEVVAASSSVSAL